MNARHRRTYAAAAAGLAAVLALSACSDRGGEGKNGRDGKNDRTTGAEQPDGSGRDGVPVKPAPAKKDQRPRTLPFAPQNVPVPWSR
jgi:hypothetical protein